MTLGLSLWLVAVIAFGFALGSIERALVSR